VFDWTSLRGCKALWTILEIGQCVI